MLQWARNNSYFYAPVFSRDIFQSLLLLSLECFLRYLCRCVFRKDFTTLFGSQVLSSMYSSTVAYLKKFCQNVTDAIL